MILVSACLLGENCKYSGGNNKNKQVIEFLKDKSFIKVCPEVMGGLSTPRLPAEILEDKVYNKNGIDVTKEFMLGAELTLDIALQNSTSFAILKSKSPSCGINYIYDGTFSGNLIKGYGFTAKLLLEHNIKVIDENDPSISKSNVM